MAVKRSSTTCVWPTMILEISSLRRRQAPPSFSIAWRSSAVACGAELNGLRVRVVDMRSPRGLVLQRVGYNVQRQLPARIAVVPVAVGVAHLLEMSDGVILRVQEDEAVFHGDPFQFDGTGFAGVPVAGLLNPVKRAEERVIGGQRRQLLVGEHLPHQLSNVLVEGAVSGAVVDEQE